jgi:hypothetical protein
MVIYIKKKRKRRSHPGYKIYTGATRPTQKIKIKINKETEINKI